MQLDRWLKLFISSGLLLQASLAGGAVYSDPIQASIVEQAKQDKQIQRMRYADLPGRTSRQERQSNYIRLLRAQNRILFYNPLLEELDETAIDISDLPSPEEMDIVQGHPLIQLPGIDIRYGAWHGRSPSKMGKIGRNLRILRTKAEDNPKNNHYPNIFLGAEFEPLIQYGHNQQSALNPKKTPNDSTKLLINTATLYAIGNVNNWMTLDFGYKFASDTLDGLMLILGDLRVSPFFFSGGKQYGQFGIFSNYAMTLTPLPRDIFRINTVTTNLGYASEWMDLQVSALANQESSDFNAVSANAVFRWTMGDNFGWQFGGSLVSNILNKTNVFSDPIFAQTVHRLPSVDVNGSMVWGSLEVQTEFAQVLRSTPTFNKVGAFSSQARYLLPTHTTLFPTYLYSGYSQIVNGSKIFTNPAYRNKRLPQKRIDSGILLDVFDYTQIAIEYGYGRSYFAKNSHVIRIILNLQV